MVTCSYALNKSYFPNVAFLSSLLLQFWRFVGFDLSEAYAIVLMHLSRRRGDSASILFQRFTRRCVKLTRFWNALGVPIVWNPYRITPIHWLMAQKPPSTFSRRIFYWRTRHLLLRFLCRKGPCRQREELGSKRGVSFPIQRTRVTRVNQDVLFHRFTWLCIKLTRFGNDKPNTPS